MKPSTLLQKLWNYCNLKLNDDAPVIAPDADGAALSLTGEFARLSEPSFLAIWDNPLDADYDHL